MRGRPSRTARSARARRASAAPHSVLLVDDHPLVREGIRACLESLPQVKVVGQASDGDEALWLIRQNPPDLVLMDITMPQLNGLKAAKLVAREFPETKVLVLTVHDQKEYAAEALRAGAAGYLVKDSPPRVLLRAIRQVLAGRRFFNISGAAASRPRKRAKKQALPLSNREKQVLRLAARGWANKEIARRLKVTVNTVLTYRKRIMRKFSLNNASSLIRFALQRGFLDPRR